MNPILETIGIVNLQRSADPEHIAIGQVMSMVAELSGSIEEIKRNTRKPAYPWSALTLQRGNELLDASHGIQATATSFTGDRNALSSQHVSTPSNAPPIGSRKSRGLLRNRS